MAQSPVLKAVGLYTFANKLSEIPSGSLLEASNVVIDRDGVIEPRRGLYVYDEPMTSPAHQLLVYKGRILRHYGAGAGTKLEFDTGTVDSDGMAIFSAFSGSVAEVSQGTRIRSLEANGNLYFTTSNGIKKISATSASDFSTSAPSVTTKGTIIDAGGIKALDATATLDYSQTGFFLQDSVVGYRIVWGIKDANTNVVTGPPSARVIIENPITGLLIRDFNQLLYKLDAGATANGGDRLVTTSWNSTYKVAATASANTLRTNLISVADALDTELHKEVDPALANKTVSASVTSNVATLDITTTLTTVLKAGDKVKISGLTAAGAVDLNGTWTVTDASGTFIKFAVTHVDFAVIADTGGTVIKKVYRNTDPETITLPTSEELLSLQAFYDAMINNLVLEPTSSIDAAAQVAANFKNSTQSAIVSISFTIPANVTTSHFYQVYRTGLTTSSGPVNLDSLDPGDTLGLVYEGNPSTSDLSAGSITYSDITPESFRGADLYTNPNQEGIAQANEIPPLAKDLALFRGSTFYANTKTKHRKNIALLGVTKLVGGSSTITISNGTASSTYTFVTPVKEVTSVTTVIGASVSGGQYFTLNAANDARQYYVWYTISGVGVDPALSGKTGIKVDITAADTAATVATKTVTEINKNNDFSVPAAVGAVITITNSAAGITTDATQGTTSFVVSVTTQGAGEDAANKKVLISQLATPSQQVDESARSLVRVINKNASENVYAYYLSGPTDVPGLILLENRTLADVSFFITCDNATTTGASVNPVLPTSGQTVISSNEVAPNRVYYSKDQQPEAVPLLNYLDIGPKDKKIVRILALRDSVFVLKEDAIYRISGETTTTFVASLFDSSTSIVAPDTAAVLNNQIYMFSDQGIATISDTGVSIISRAIENLIKPLGTAQYTNFKTASWAISYESERSYFVWTVTNPSDTVATQCFRYNTFTNSWTQLPISKTCGVINSADTKMYLGAGDINNIEVERKTFTRKDYADRQYVLNVLTGIVTSNQIGVSSTLNTTVGDVVIQSQTLTINKYNRTLQKLDADLGIHAKNYYSSVKASPGDDLRSKLTAFALKLDADTTDGGYSTAISGFGSDFAAIQNAYNAIIGKINLDTHIVDANFPLSTGTIDFEAKITAVDTFKKIITVAYPLNFISGPIILYKHIPTKITWAPQVLSDATMLKHVRESTILFDNDAFTSATVLYSSDLSPSFDSIDFNGMGTGIWGYSNNWGDDFWGGLGSGAPFRTLVPLEKQRCRYIQCQIQHNNAFEKYGILGNSYTYELNSSKAYR